MAAPPDDGPTGNGWVIPRLICVALVGTPVAGAILMFVAAAYVGAPRIYRSLTPDVSGLLPAAAIERSSAFKEHQAIFSVAKTCVDGERLTAATEPFSYLTVDGAVGERLSPREVAAALPGYLDAMLYLSQRISDARSQLAGRAVTDELIAELFEWTIVATGLFTTILISVKSFANPGSRGYLPMAVTAIVLSSFGTAVATLNSFYTPRIVYEKTDRSLASLRSLHVALASQMLREKAACEDKTAWTDWRARHVRDLTSSFVAIMDATSNTAASAAEGPQDEKKPEERKYNKPEPGAAPAITPDNRQQAQQ